jgi:hypothetical protein
MGDLHHSVGRRTILKAGVASSAVQIASPSPVFALQSSVICMLPRWCLKVAARFEKL